MNGEDLRRRRRELQISQAELGKRLGVPQQTIARWETGAHRIEHGQMLDLALRALEHEPAELVRGDDGD